MVLLSKNFSTEKSDWRVLPESVRLVNNYPEQKTAAGHPKAFKLPEVSGVSDHWPVAVDIEFVK